MSNFAILSGKLLTLSFDHESYGEKFMKGFVECKRLSGTVDIIPVIISESLQGDDFVNQNIIIRGSVKTKNLEGKLFMYVFADEIGDYFGEDDINEVHINGFLCKDPVYRITPFNKKITNLLIASNRRCGKVDYLPCICWSKYAEISRGYKTGNEVDINGRFQSRSYEKNNNKYMTYEISAMEITRKE